VGNVIALCSMTMLVSLIRRWAKLEKDFMLLWSSLPKLRYFLFVDQASIQNVINTTTIFINLDIPEAHQFKDRFVI
jgi:hypothetical protein